MYEKSFFYFNVCFCCFYLNILSNWIFNKIDDYKDKVVFKIQYAPTRLKDLQKKSKLLVFHSSIYYGDEKDRTVTITINKGKKNDK